MPITSIINQFGTAVSGLLGGNRTNTASQSQASTPKTPVVDVSKDRLDLTVPTGTVKEPAPPVVAYVPPVELPKAPEQLLPQPAPVAPPPVASAPADEPALPVAPADLPAAIAALAESDRADDAAAASAAGSSTAVATTSTGTGVSAEAEAPVASRASVGASLEPASPSTDEDKARAMAIKALDQERRLNMASFLTEASASSIVAESQKAAARASAELAETRRPALLVA